MVQPFVSELDNEHDSLSRNSNSSFTSSDQGELLQQNNPTVPEHSTEAGLRPRWLLLAKRHPGKLVAGPKLQRPHPNLAVNGNNVEPVAPSEYDRYPSMAGSRVVSSTSLASQMRQEYSPKLGSGSGTPDDDDSMRSTNPFVSNVDFSPFGGYPASSFPLHIDEKEPDDYLHNPDPIADAAYDKNRFWYDLKTMDRRALGGALECFLLLAGVVVFVLLPVLFYSGATTPYHPEVYEVLSHYKYPLELHQNVACGPRHPR
ncbi:beta-glucan synthesis-associated protein SKN1 [Candidozyma auris]|nr:beta-glucan synthesis-associated protein SKN1 [[Candida] auris]